MLYILGDKSKEKNNCPAKPNLLNLSIGFEITIGIKINKYINLFIISEPKLNIAMQFIHFYFIIFAKLPGMSKIKINK